jgi:hypothetical protein
LLKVHDKAPAVTPARPLDGHKAEKGKQHGIISGAFGKRAHAKDHMVDNEFAQPLIIGLQFLSHWPMHKSICNMEELRFSGFCLQVF